jgi:hypothetical protein
MLRLSLFECRRHGQEPLVGRSRSIRSGGEPIVDGHREWRSSRQEPMDGNASI